MATLYVRDVPDVIYQAVQEIATARHQSLNAYINEMLKIAIEREKTKEAAREALQRLRELRASVPANTVDTTELLRQLRDNPRM